MTTEVLDQLERADEAVGTALLTVEVRRIRGICVLALRGELTSASLAVLEAHMDHLAQRTCRHVVLDASGLGALDEPGARVLIGLRHYMAARGGRLQVVGAGEEIAQRLAHTRLVNGEGSGAAQAPHRREPRQAGRARVRPGCCA